MAKAALKAAPPPESSREDDPAAPEAVPKKKGRGRLVLLILLLLAAGGGAGAWFMLEEAAPAAPEPAKKAIEKPAVFVNLDTFTVNLQPETGDQYLQTSLTVKATHEGVPEAMKVHTPEIRNALLLLLSSKLPSQILTVEGKQQLADEILVQVKKPLPETLREHVTAVYYTSFVVQ